MWHLKYRPRKVSELDLKDVRDKMTSMMESGSIPQVLLFAGPKGTGKTSTSRIIGAMLNDEQNEAIVDYQYFDGDKPKKLTLNEPSQSDFNQKIFQGHSFVVQEMDAASNRGIDDIRQLQEKSMLPPTQGKMSVFILDEAHMLTNSAFNALLKLLEEPPKHVIFILATTELHKIPDTVVSRATLVNFRKASNQEIRSRLEKILKKEDLQLDDDIINFVIYRSDGSLRDAVKLCEQAVQAQETGSDVQKALGMNIAAIIRKLLTSVIKKDEVALLETINEARVQRIDEKFFQHALFEVLHASVLSKYGLEKKDVPFFSDINIDSQAAHFILNYLLKQDLDQTCSIAFLKLELALLDLVLKAKKRNDSGSGENKVKKSSKKKKQAKSKKKSKKKVKQSKKTDEKVEEKLDLRDNENLQERWQEILELVNNENKAIGAILKSAKPKFTQNKLILQVYYNFHREQLERSNSRKSLVDCCQQVLKKQLEIDINLESEGEKSIQTKEKNTANQTHGEVTSTKDSEIVKMTEEILIH